ncbi:Anaerobic nitric oxide reductase transcription regulator NorR [bioreactor metagenome]|uniref:Anaerobic nitric oxide reductase transcription regulator NorR n=1 Tax=bioreactor metagenome TaxID=1076179 RepID=A0A644YWC5_9ZZZZ
MKTILMIYNNRENWNVIEYLKRCVESIFENYVQVENVFLTELGEHEMIEGDIYLVLYEHMIYILKKHITDFDKVVVMTRGINKKFVNEIRKVADNTDILVVNDSYESTIQTTNTFYELGISNINFIPYEKRLDVNNFYNDIKIAITPDEMNLIPPHIEKVINIGYREIGYDTTIRIMQKLRLGHKSVNRNIIKNMNDIVEPNAVFKSNYLNSYLKGEMLDKMIFNSYEGILLTDSSYNLVYSNEKLNRIFNVYDDYTDKSIDNFVEGEICNLICCADFKSKLIKINEENYAVEKSPVMLMDHAIGYNFIFRHEKDIRDLEINLKNNLVKKGLFAKYSFEKIIHKSNAMMHCISLSKKAALTNFTILIQGESGTGKELMAQSIHNFSDRKEMPFVAINCASLPESLLESQLFGYEGGSFTGASKNGKIGLFEQANTGTLFLDEIGDISPNVQSQLLRVIQEKQIMRIGSDRVINIDVRIIVATNKNLEEEVHKGNFRSDLFYRLNVIPIKIPPLRERKEDVIMLLSAALNDRNVTFDIPDEVMEALKNYEWPGNVRELINCCEYIVSMESRFSLETLPDYMKEKILYRQCASADQPQAAATDTPEVDAQKSLLELIEERNRKGLGAGRKSLSLAMMEHGQPIGEGAIRALLEQLQQDGLITCQKGRGGTRLTQRGKSMLAR